MSIFIRFAVVASQICEITRNSEKIRTYNSSRSSKVKAYVTNVRPLLQYAVCVWSPYQLDDIAKIESVQRRFTKRLPGLSNASYSDRLSILGLRSLQLCRLHQDLIYTYKLFSVWWIWIAPSSSLSAQTKQHVGTLVNCLYVRVAWTLESTFLETVLLKFGIACQQQ